MLLKERRSTTATVTAIKDDESIRAKPTWCALFLLMKNELYTTILLLLLFLLFLYTPYKCMYLYRIRVCAYVSVYVCTHVRRLINIFTYIYICIYTFIYIHN